MCLTLRYYVFTSDGLRDGGREVVYDLIAQAEQASAEICEECGRAGRLSDGPWLRVGCSKHR